MAFHVERDQRRRRRSGFRSICGRAITTQRMADQQQSPPVQFQMAPGQFISNEFDILPPLFPQHLALLLYIAVTVQLWIGRQLLLDARNRVAHFPQRIDHKVVAQVAHAVAWAQQRHG